MKRIIYISLITVLSLGLFSCQKLDNENAGTKSDVFTAVIADVSTKSTIDASKVKWESTDEININGSTYTTIPNGTDATKATFEKKSGTDPTATFKAIFPASLYIAGHFELPASLAYTAGKFNMPMYAESESTSLTFKNIFGVLRITVANTVNVKSIAVSSDLYMNGVFTVADNKASVADGDAANKTTTLTCNPAVAGTDFYIPVPAGTYTGKNLKVKLTKSDESTETMTTNQSTTIVITEGTIYGFTFLKDGSFKLIESPTIEAML